MTELVDQNHVLIQADEEAPDFPREWLKALAFAQFAQKKLGLNAKEMIDIFNHLIVYGFQAK